MNNFRISVLVLLLLSVFACSTQQISEDEAPLDIRSSLSNVKEQPVNSTQKSSLTMIITVQYPENTDRDTFRAQVGPLLGLDSWSSCFCGISV